MAHGSSVCVCAFVHTCMFTCAPEIIVSFPGQESTKVSGLTWMNFSHSRELVTELWPMLLILTVQ